MIPHSRVRAVCSHIFLVGLSALGAARGTEAQVVPYVGLGVERAPLDGPPIEGLAGSGGLRALFLAGLRHEGGEPAGVGHGLELEIGWLDEQRTQADWTPAQGEAPIRLGLTAWTLTGSYTLVAPVHRWPVRPFVRLGGTRGYLTHESSSDTPTEEARSSVWGAHAGGGVEATLGSGLRLSLTGSYSAYADPDDRPLPAMELGGWAFGARMTLDL